MITPKLFHLYVSNVLGTRHVKLLKWQKVNAITIDAAQSVDGNLMSKNWIVIIWFSDIKSAVRPVWSIVWKSNN
jgi:hypothetical protein